MKNNLKMAGIALALIGLTISANVNAGNKPAEIKTAGDSLHKTCQSTCHLSLEVDPADYLAYNGWGAFVGFRTVYIPHWRFRIGGGAASLLSSAVETNNNNKGWKMRLDPVITVAAHWYPGDKRSGFFTGPFVGWSTMKFTAPSGDKIYMKNVFAGADIGYRWFPFKNAGLVITPHLGVVVPVYKNNEPRTESEHYDLSPISPMPQLLIGYEF